MLELSQLDLDEIATALSDQSDYDHRWLIDPQSGQVAFWTSDTGIDGQNPVDLEDVDLTPIDPLPSYIWYQDMVDFADRLSNDGVGRRLERAIQGQEPSGGSRTRCTRSSPRSCRPGTPSGKPAPTDEPSNGSRMKTLIAEHAADQYRQDHPDPDLP